MAAIEDYTDLVTSQYNQKPNFMAVIAATLQPMVDGINLLEGMPAKFDLDTARGDQLDAVGEWIGLNRRLRVPIDGVFFAFDTVGVGFDQGIWWEPGMPLTEMVAMDDGTYRKMLKAKVAANSWDGSLGDANAKIAELFGNGAVGTVQIKDNFDMTESVIVAGTIESILFSRLVEGGYLQFKPAGVGET